MIRVSTVCHSNCIFWIHYCIIKPSCLILGQYGNNFRYPNSQFLSSPLAVKRNILFTILLRCMCVHERVHSSRFVLAGFQNYVTQLLSLRSSAS